MIQTKLPRMSPEQFVYWLQGFFEMTDADSLSKKQVRMIKEHLGLVFMKLTPDYTLTTTNDETQEILVEDEIEPDAEEQDDEKDAEEHIRKLIEDLPKDTINPWQPSPFPGSPVVPLWREPNTGDRWFPGYPIVVC